MQHESIYNLIPKEYVLLPQELMYKSAYPNGLLLTANTFNNHTTSLPQVNNINGDFELVKGPHTRKGHSNSLGKPKGNFNFQVGSYKPDTALFRMKCTGTMRSNQLPEIQSFKYSQICKAAVPKRDEKPIHRLKSNWNFIVTNAVENILSAPNQATEEKTRWKWNNGNLKFKPEYVDFRNKRIFNRKIRRIKKFKLN